MEVEGRSEWNEARAGGQGKYGRAYAEEEGVVEQGMGKGGQHKEEQGGVTPMEGEKRPAKVRERGKRANWDEVRREVDVSRG